MCAAKADVLLYCQSFEPLTSQIAGLPAVIVKHALSRGTYEVASGPYLGKSIGEVGTMILSNYSGLTNQILELGCQGLVYILYLRHLATMKLRPAGTEAL